MRLLIVNFHYIRDEKPLSGIYPISCLEFKQQLEELGKYYRFISQNDLCEYITNDHLPDTDCCMITFDDGLKEQLSALDILQQLSIPAVIYATTQPTTQATAHDTHKLHYIYSKLQDEEIFALLNERFYIGNYIFDEQLLNEEYRYDSMLKKKIKFFLNFVIHDSDRKKVVNFLFSQLTSNEASFVKNLYMDANDLVKLARAGMLGTHTHTHSALATLSSTEIQNEINSSIKTLEELTTTRIRSISYPFGGPAAVNPEVAALASKAGLIYGLTMNRGLNDDHDIRNCMMLKRVDTNDAPGGKLNSQRYAL